MNKQTSVPPCAHVLGVTTTMDDTMTDFFDKYLKGLRLKEVESRSKAIKGRYEYLRPPVPNWYEMAGKDFTRELHKNRHYTKEKHELYQKMINDIKQEIGSKNSKGVNFDKPMSGLEKTIAKLRRSIAEGNYYESHQMYRTVSNRFVKQKNYSDAKAIVYIGAKELLAAGQVGSGADLCKLLLELYAESATPVHDETVNPLIQLFRLFPAGESKRNGFMEATLKWTVKSGWYQDGDPVLRHEYGSVLLAEQQFVLGTDESARQLAAMLGPWCRSETGDQYSFGTVIMYATRTLLKLLVGRRPQQASVFLQAFSRQYSADLTVLDTAVKPESPHSDGEEHQIFQHPLMNFMHFLIATTVNRQNKDCYLAVSKRYGELLKRVYPESVKLLDDVGQIYFGIVPQQPGGQLNLNALLGAMFGGGNGGIPSG